MRSISSAVMIVNAIGASAFFSPWHLQLYEYERDVVPSSWIHREERPSWTATPDAFVFRTRVPPLEPGTVSATLAADGASLSITGKRKMAGCSCEPSDVTEIPLPYRPRTEDVALELDPKIDVVTVKLARSAKEADAPSAVKVVVANDPTEARPLRFVPHESATATMSATSSEMDEARLADKFRKVALAVRQQKEEPGESVGATDDTSKEKTTVNEPPVNGAP